MPLPSVSDIVKLLEQIPGWKTLYGLPKRVAELEAKVATLEAKLGGPTVPAGLRCPICGETMRVVSERPHPTFGVMGHKVHDTECPNGHKSSRDYTPGKGYA